MTLIVEDGSGLANAESYASVAETSTYLAAYKTATELATWTGLAADVDRERCMRVATQYVDAVYGGRYPGSRISDTMALLWPRNYASDREGFAINSNVIPTSLKQAVMEMALRVAAGDDLLAKLDDPGMVLASSVSVGPISEQVTYQGGKPTRPSYPLVDRILTNLLGSPGVLYPG